MKYAFAVIGLALTPLASATIASPGAWTAHQPDQDSVGGKQKLIGTPSYFYSVLEVENGAYTTIKDQADGYIKYATLNEAGEMVPSEFIVGRDDPTTNNIPLGVKESPSVIKRKCKRNAYCSWKLNNNGKSHGSPPSGEYKNLVVVFKFADHTDRVIDAQALDSDLFNDHHHSVKDFFEKQSFGDITMINDLVPEVIISKSESYCADNASGLSMVVHECLKEAIAGKDTSDYDMVTFVHSGYGAEFGDQDEYDTYFDDRLWSHAWELESPEYTGRYALFSAFFKTGNGHINRVGIPAHEIAQAMGAPALYGDGGYGLGYYDIMSHPFGFDGTLYNCGSMSAYTKNLFEWVDIEEITEDGVYTLSDASFSNKVYKISKGFPEDEYFLIENRVPTDYDKGMRQTGLAIYHVDETANDVGGHPSDGIFPKNHYRVSLIQADGRYDLEREEDGGDMGDLFHGLRYTGFGPDGPFDANGDALITQEGTVQTEPNTKAYRGGNLVDTGITITELSKPGDEMTFKVTFSESSSS